LNYFGEVLKQPCGICDLCRNPNQSQASSMQAMEATIVQTLLDEGTLNAYQLVQLTKSTPEAVAIALHSLLKQGNILGSEAGYSVVN
jgi:superfamily II DNA helicase RecQ